jgi:flagellar biosynthesis repressor protein FlbT
MNRPMHLSLRAGARIYINGAVIRVDRKVTLELMNDVVFLLESHVLQADQTTTPLRQLYFVLQTILMDPVNAATSLYLYKAVFETTLRSFTNEVVVSGLKTVAELVAEERIFDALRTIRGLFETEDKILSQAGAHASKAA